MEAVEEMLEHPICSYFDIQQNKYVLNALKYNSVEFIRYKITFIKYNMAALYRKIQL